MLAKASAEAALKAKDDECTQALLEESTKYSEALREKEDEISGIVGEKIKMQDEIDKLQPHQEVRKPTKQSIG